MKILNKAIAKSGAWGIFGRLTSALLTILVSLLLARLLSPSDMGVYFLAVSISSFLATFSSLGVPITAMRFIATAEARSDRHRSNQLARFALLVGIGLATVVTGLLCAGLGRSVGLSIFNSPALASLNILICFWAMLLTIQGFVAEVYRGFHRIDLAMLSGGLLSSGLLVAALFVARLIAATPSLNSIVQLTTVCLAFGLSCAVPLLRWLRPWDFSVQPTTARTIISTAWPIWLHGLAAFGLLQASIWIIGARLGKEDVAIYGAASRLAALFSLVNGMFYAFLPPTIVKLYSTNKSVALQELLRTSSTAGAIAMMPPLLLCIIFPEFLLSLFFGEFYARGALVLGALATANYLNLATGVRGYLLLVCGHERHQLGIAVFGGASTILLVFGGVELAGISGGAVGACVGVILQCVLEMVAVWHRLGILTLPYWNPRDFLQVIKESGLLASSGSKAKDT